MQGTPIEAGFKSIMKQIPTVERHTVCSCDVLKFVHFFSLKDDNLGVNRYYCNQTAIQIMQSSIISKNVDSR